MACCGIKLMMGNDNPWAELAYSYCSANAEYYNAMLDIALHIFVNIPKIKCVCIETRGQPAHTYVQDVCAPRLPLSVRPEMYMMVSLYSGISNTAFRNLACDAAVNNLKTSMRESLTPVFENMEKGLEAMNSLFDYLLVPLTKILDNAWTSPQTSTRQFSCRFRLITSWAAQGPPCARACVGTSGMPFPSATQPPS